MHQLTKLGVRVRKVDHEGRESVGVRDPGWRQRPELASGGLEELEDIVRHRLVPFERGMNHVVEEAFVRQGGCACGCAG